jgi:ligand-binding sensor domain-containing protein
LNHRAFVAFLGATLVVLCMVPQLLAGAAQPLSDYTITSWTRRDGIAPPIWSIAQDKAGYLWLGTGSGLVRFDGHRFVAWESLGYGPLPGSTILALRSARDGSLWIGAGDAGIGRLV